jgi:hypothetical protein
MSQLTIELTKSYIDTSNSVNARTIGLFPTNNPAITGESWFLSSQKQQTLRQIYTFTSTSNLPHGIANIIPGQFVRCFGSYTDGTNTYGLPFATNVSVAGLITFWVGPTNIRFQVGAGAPSLSSGVIVLEWLANT